MRPVSARGLISASVAAGLPVGLLYGAAALLFASPPLEELEVLEHGVRATTHGLTGPLGTLVGALALAVGLSLILTPIARAFGSPTWRAGLIASALCGLGLVAWSGWGGTFGHLPQAVPAPPELAERFHTGALITNGVLLTGFAVAIPWALRRLAP